MGGGENRSSSQNQPSRSDEKHTTGHTLLDFTSSETSLFITDDSPWLGLCHNTLTPARTPRLFNYNVCVWLEGCNLNMVHSLGAVWESRWTSWAVRPNEPSGFRGRKDLLHRACLSLICHMTSEDIKHQLINTWQSGSLFSFHRSSFPLLYIKLRSQRVTFCCRWGFAGCLYHCTDK